MVFRVIPNKPNGSYSGCMGSGFRIQNLGFRGGVRPPQRPLGGDALRELRVHGIYDLGSGGGGGVKVGGSIPPQRPRVSSENSRHAVSSAVSRPSTPVCIYTYIYTQTYIYIYIHIYIHIYRGGVG